MPTTKNEDPGPTAQEILAALLAISPEDAAEVREEADVKAKPMSDPADKVGK